MQITAIDDAAWDSPWRHRRVSEKVLLSLGLVVTALALSPWPAAPLVAAASLVAILGLARIRASLLVAAMAAPTTFIVIGAATVALNVGRPPADALWQWGWLSMPADGPRRAIDVLAHGLAGTLAVMVLAVTTPMVDLLTWLRRLRVPDALLEIASLTYRLLFVLLSTVLSVRASHHNRLGDDPGPGWAGFRRRWHNTGTMMGAIMVRSWDRAERLTRGMDLRGFENALVTLPVARKRSWPMVAATGCLLVGIWTLGLLT